MLHFRFQALVSHTGSPVWSVLSCRVGSTHGDTHCHPTKFL